MKNIIIFTMVILSFMVNSCTDDDNSDNNQVVELSEQEKNDLQTLREEEKLARDVYLYAYDKYNFNVFNNISNSEQSHMDKILVLLNKYNLSDPALANRGEFTNEELQNLYTSLTAQVDISLIEALKVGATIEDLDIKDIIVFKNRTDKENIDAVYEVLECGSRNHMRAYYGKLLDNQVIYDSQFISVQELTTIINGSHEQCGN